MMKKSTTWIGHRERFHRVGGTQKPAAEHDAQILAISLYQSRDTDFSVRLIFVDLDLDLSCLLSKSGKF